MINAKVDPQINAALLAADAATKRMPKLNEPITGFAKRYQRGKTSKWATGFFSARVARQIVQADYQVPQPVLALLSILNQASSQQTNNATGSCPL